MDLQNTYTNIVEIGSGGGGTVFRAYHVRMQKYVVLKKIHDSIQNSVDIRGELDILKNLRHSYLPSVIDFIQDNNGSIYTVMDYIPGESFESMLRRGVRFPQAKVIKYAAQLGEVLAYLQTQPTPIIHGDIKPANIMLTPEDNICLIDFNISTMQNGAVSPNMGYTPGYASPEQVSMVTSLQQYYYNYQVTQQVAPAPIMNQKLDERSDIYSVGATLYALLSGYIPNSDWNQIVPIEQLVPDCSEGLAHVIHCCLEADPTQRYSNAREYLKAVTAIAKVDKRYKRLVWKQDLTVIFCIIGMGACIVLSVFGRQQMRNEKIEAYNQIVEQMRDLQGTGEDDKFERLYEESVAQFPRMPGAHYEKALYLYNQRRFEEAIDYIQNDVLNNTSGFSQEELGEFYFLLANNYLENEDLTDAIVYYKTAVSYKAYDSTYYSDYAIALAQDGQLDEAEEILEKAEEMGLSTDRLLLAEGEIQGKRGETEAAAQSFQDCIAETKDSYVKLRAYIRWSKLYDSDTPTQEALSAKKEILSEAEMKVDEQDKAMVLEQLAQVYIDLGGMTGSADDYMGAVSCLQKVEELGWDVYTTHETIGILYMQTGNYDKAQETFEGMLKEYGEDYRIYKQLAFLEISRQAVLDNSYRNYDKFLEYYKKAVKLFEDSGARADSDQKMQLLKQDYEQLKIGNWFVD